MNIARHTLLGLLVSALSLFGACTPASPPATQGGASANRPLVFLTFDDGPSPTYTSQVLDILNRNGVKATFFVMGQNAVRHPDLLDRMHAEGQMVANHTWSHMKLTSASDAAVAQQIRSTQDVIASHGFTSRCVRPPYGATNDRVRSIIRSAGNGSHSILWDIDTNDWRRPGAGVIADRVVRGLRPGAVVLMHDAGGDRRQTVEALQSIIDRVRASGYDFGLVCK